MNAQTIYSARNHTKRQYKVYLYEAQAAMLKSLGCTRSEAVFGITAAFLGRIGKRIDLVLTPADRLIIHKIRRAIADNV